jgi:hypothetical protein
MGAVRVDLTAARAAVEVAASQAADLVRSLPDPSSRVPGLDWTVGQTAAHLVAAARFYPRYATGQATPEATIDLAEGNLHRIAQVGDHGLVELADLLVAEPQRLFEQTADLAPDHPVAFHGGATLDLAAQIGILLGEYLVHGLDLARSARRPWPIDPDHARLVIAGATALLPAIWTPTPPGASGSATMSASAAARGSACESRMGPPPSSRDRSGRWTATSRPSRWPSSSWPMVEAPSGRRSFGARSQPGAANPGERSGSPASWRTPNQWRSRRRK